MIAADHIKFSDDGKTAWLVVNTNDERGPWTYGWLDRPCDTCGGLSDVVASGSYYNKADDWPIRVRYSPCPDCRGSGRHCFPIAVQAPFRSPYEEDPPRTLTVSVVPGMVLPMKAVADINTADAQFVQDDDGDWFAVGLALDDGDDPLPSAAAPGMFAVKLTVYERNTQ